MNITNTGNSFKQYYYVFLRLTPTSYYNKDVLRAHKCWWISGISFISHCQWRIPKQRLIENSQ